MQILITGSAGRVGSSMVDELQRRGHTVRGFDLNAGGSRESGYSEVVGSFDDADACRRAVEGVDVVVHLGAFMSWSPQDADAMFRANVDGTRRLLEAAAASGVRRFVFASSGEVYPENDPCVLPITEEHPLRPTSPYGLTKLLGEELVGFHQRRGTMETVILRFSHTQNASELLDEDSFFSGPRFFLKPRIRQQERFGNMAVAKLLRGFDTGAAAHILARNEQGRPFRMHITETRDMVAGLVLAVEDERAAGGVFNLGATDPVDFTPLVEKMSEITGYPVVTVDLPGAGVYYETSNRKIRETLGYVPQWTIDRMLVEAGEARKARLKG
ncbi:NAD(P)-dependent oxidoreductase [uncultured Nitratireductor sp.]|uniref:NAD-dependent epimerase/dehydratase family protein n=1 Tax=uncultured Nitratireductor sp. TaxID=520953 RepID=UPI0025F73B53|nr:NAD(P)-dependent oxidoreductase [uncultured Nitratireductor sp.]